MSNWEYTVIGSCGVLLVFLIGMEVRRPARARLMARVAATILAVGALACLILPVTYSRSIQRETTEGILLTEGYDPDSVRVFREGHPGAVVASYSGEARRERGPAAAWHVFGYGLTKEQWKEMHPAGLVFHPSPERTGVIAVDWKRRLWPGERLRVQGRLAVRREEKAVRLELIGMNTVLDSVQVRPEGDFELGTVPAQIGRGVYRLIVRVGRDTLEQEAIPVEVAAVKPLRVLLVSAAPAFENTFLVNWLSNNGHAVASRTAVSRDKYHTAFANLPELPLHSLTASLLDKFDIVIADGASLTAAGSGELSALRGAIAEKGLGLIIQLDSAARGVAGFGGEEGTRLLGAGKVTIKRSNNTYSQLMAGEKGAYAAYWSGVLRKVAREGEPREEWQWAPVLPRVDEPVVMRLASGAADLPQGYAGAGSSGAGGAMGGEHVGAGRSVYLAQDTLLPFSWEGRYWPESAGWQVIRTLRGDSAWWYAWPGDGWAALYRAQRMQATREYIRGLDGKGTGPALGSGVEKVAVPKGLFFVILLLCWAFLWVERKMEGMSGGIVT